MRRWLWIGVPLASLCVLLAVGVDALLRTARALARLSRADDIRLTLDELATSLDDAESGERAYLATGDRRFLEPYDRIKTTWQAELDAFRHVTDPSQREEVDEIDSLTRRMLDVMDRTLAAHDANVLAVDLGEAAAVTASIRRVGRQIENDARSIASRRAATATNREHWEIVAFALVVLSFVAGTALVTRQRQRDETRRRRAEERAALLDVTDEFIGVLGHDLRNPLGASLMAAKLLAGRALESNDAMLVQRIRRSNERMLRMIDALLDLARARLGPGIPVARTPCDLRDVVANVVDEIRTRYPDRRVLWDWRGDGFGRWDYDRMSQAVSNLVGNAVEHGDPTRPVDVRLEGIGPAIDLAVHNYGESIPAESLPTLFASYKRASTSSHHHGLGLGLFITDQIVRAHGGTLLVTSTPIEGTTFKASFTRDTTS